eukprot:11460659-Alexandrium_andersonii.AAC.1
MCIRDSNAAEHRCDHAAPVLQPPRAAGARSLRTSAVSRAQNPASLQSTGVQPAPCSRRQRPSRRQGGQTPLRPADALQPAEFAQHQNGPPADSNQNERAGTGALVR